MDYILETRQLTKKFGNKLAVDHVNMHIRKGDIYGLIGKNGAGKTTTIRMLCGLSAMASGTASVLGYDVSRETDQVKRAPVSLMTVDRILRPDIRTETGCI